MGPLSLVKALVALADWSPKGSAGEVRTSVHAVHSLPAVELETVVSQLNFNVDGRRPVDAEVELAPVGSGTLILLKDMMSAPLGKRKQRTIQVDFIKAMRAWRCDSDQEDEIFSRHHVTASDVKR